MRTKDQILLEKAYQKIYEEVETSTVENEDDDKFGRLREWKKQNKIQGMNEYWNEVDIFETYFNKRMSQLADELFKDVKAQQKHFSGRGDYNSDLYNTAFKDDIINDLMNFNLDKDEEGYYYVYNKGKKIKGQDDVFDYFYNKFGWQDDDENEEEYDRDYSSDYDDPTGQDEPIDTRSYSEIEMSDRLDAASRMDPDQAAEYRRGA